MDQTFLIFSELRNIWRGSQTSAPFEVTKQHYRNIFYAFDLVVNTLSIGREFEDTKLEGEETSDKHMAIKDGYKTQHPPDILSNNAAHLWLGS